MDGPLLSDGTKAELGMYVRHIWLGGNPCEIRRILDSGEIITLDWDEMTTATSRAANWEPINFKPIRYWRGGDE